MQRARYRGTVVGSCALSLGFLAALSAPASASVPSGVAAVRLSVDTVVTPPTAVVALSGTGYGSAERADVFFDVASGVPAATFVTSTSGRWTGQVRVPAWARPKPHWWIARGRQSGRVASVAVLVRTDWAQSGFGSQQTGANPYENVITRSNAYALLPRWSVFDPSGGPLSAPVIANGMAIVTNEYYGEVDAFDATTGALRWHVRVDDEWAQSDPVVANGMVYLATGDMDTLEALDVRSGTVRWQVSTGVDFSRMVVADGVVYMAARPNGYGAVKTCAFDGANGATKWCAPYAGSVSAVANGIVYTIVIDDYSGKLVKLVALDASDGHLLWKSAPINSVTVANGIVYGSKGPTLYALDARTGIRRWSLTTPNTSFGTPSVTGTVLIIDSTVSGSNSRMNARNALTGAPMWSTSLDGTTFTKSAIANGVVYAATANGEMWGLDASKGTRLWWADTGPNSTPEIVNGMLYFTSGDGAGGSSSLRAYGLPPWLLGP